MADDLAAPVKLLVKAIEGGIKLTTKIARRANAERAIHIVEAIPAVQRSLDQSCQDIQGAYRKCVQACGDPFAEALLADENIRDRLKYLKNEIRDRIDECQDFEDDLDSFDSAAFSSIQSEAQRCTVESISLFQSLRDRIVVGRPRENEPVPLQRSAVRHAPSRRKAVPPPQSPTAISATAPLRIPSPSEPAIPQNPWSIEGPSQFSLGQPMSPSLGTSPRKGSDRDVSPMSPPSTSDGQLRLIPREIVHHRLSANEEFLARRRQSRLIFQTELRKSVSSIEEDRVSEGFSPGSLITSPTLGSAGMSTSPVDGRGSRASLNGYDTLITRQRSLGQASQGTRSSRTSSLLQDRQIALPLRQDSQDSIFGLRSPPLSPPVSEHRSSGGVDNWSGLATTLKVPGYGHGVESGLEVVEKQEYDDEKMVVGEGSGHIQPTPTASMKSIDYPMRHDSSFYKFGGFCEGARAMVRGETGFKVVKRPSGHYSATVSARCIKCSYEVGWNDVEKDRLLEQAGIYGNSGIRWRQKFVSKCHLKTNSIETSVYACIFCIDLHQTIEDHDATVFFSVPQLFRHLATHPRPLPTINGITIIYGPQPPSVLDFDLHFTTPHPAQHPFSIRELAPKLTTRPSAIAITTHHPKLTNSASRDPDGEPVLHFALGARIIGITFPDRFHGIWCIGYHDGLRGAFPANTVSLEMPGKEDVLMNSQSSLTATAKWDFKPKDGHGKDGGGWLKFSRGERILCIGYAWVDQWCYSGQTGRGKWGLFPRCFVEGLFDSRGTGSPNIGNGTGLSSGRIGGGGGGGLGLGVLKKDRMFSFPLSRGRSSREKERRESVVSNSSVGSGNSGSGIGGAAGGGMVMVKPGLEVVQSPVHGGSVGGRWRGS